MVNADLDSRQRYAEQLHRELDLKRRCARGDLEARRELARLDDDARQQRAIEREARRAEAWREINERSQRGHAPHEVER